MQHDSFVLFTTSYFQCCFQCIGDQKNIKYKCEKKRDIQQICAITCFYEFSCTGLCRTGAQLEKDYLVGAEVLKYNKTERQQHTFRLKCLTQMEENCRKTGGKKNNKVWCSNVWSCKVSLRSGHWIYVNPICLCGCVNSQHTIQCSKISALTQCHKNQICILHVLFCLSEMKVQLRHSFKQKYIYRLSEALGCFS